MWCTILVIAAASVGFVLGAAWAGTQWMNKVPDILAEQKRKENKWREENIPTGPPRDL